MSRLQLNTSELKRVASSCGVNEKGVWRLLGSIKVYETVFRVREGLDLDPDNAGSFEKSWEIGLHLGGARSFLLADRDVIIRLVIKALRDYHNTCPKIVGWVGRGDFKPEKIPELVTKPNIVHACRTAGRLRAKVMRELSNITPRSLQ